MEKLEGIYGKLYPKHVGHICWSIYDRSIVSPEQTKLCLIIPDQGL